MTNDALNTELAAAWPDILATARTYQFDRYITATLSPRQVRQDLIVLAAFAGEMVRIPLAVTDPTIGAIRQQWWRDALLAGRNHRTGNPLADALLDVVRRHRLPAGLLVGHIDAQELELYADLVADLDTLKVHFQKCDGALFELAAMILTATSDANLKNMRNDEIIQAAGLAYGMSRSLSELRMRAQGRQMLIPADRAVVHGVSVEVTDFAQQSNALRSIVEELSESAMTAFATIQDQSTDMDRALYGALLPTTLTKTYLRRAARQFEAAMSLDTRPAPLSKAWRLFLAHWRGQF